MFDEFYYTFKVDSLPFDEMEDNIVDYFEENKCKGFCWRTDNDIVRVVTIGMTRKKVEIMKAQFKGYHIKQLYDVDILLDCLNPYYRFYGNCEIIKN